MGNTIINFLPPRGREFISECGNFVGEDVAASWLLSFGIQQLQQLWQTLEQKFLPEEIRALIQATANSNGSILVSPSATLIAKNLPRV